MPESGLGLSGSVRSALPPKADIDRRDGYVRFVPKADLTHRSKQHCNSVTSYEYSASQVCRDLSGRHSFSRPCATLAQARV